MTLLKFYTDFDQDIQIYKKWNLRKFFGEEEFNLLLKQYYPELVGKSDKEIIHYFKSNKDKLIEETKKIGKVIQTEYSRKGKTFFKQVEEITGFKWKYEEYKCHLSFSFICGGCYDAGKGNVVSIFPRLKPKNLLLDTLFHELVHLHFWSTLDHLKIKYNSKEKLNAKGIFWDLSEIEVNYVLERIKIKRYNPNFNLYPMHKQLLKKIKKHWKVDFNKFLLKSIKEIR